MTATGRATHRWPFAIVVLAVAAIAAFGPLADRPSPPRRAADVFPVELVEGLAYVPMIERDQRDADGFRDAVGGDDIAVRTVAVDGGEAPIGIRIASIVYKAKPPDREELFSALTPQVTFSAPARQRWNGHTTWVHEADALIASAALYLDDHRVVVLYGGTVAEEQAVFAALAPQL